MRPARRSCPPIQRIAEIPENTRKMIIPLIQPRSRTRVSAASRLSSTAVSNRSAIIRWRPKAWTVRMAATVSSACTATSASLSCASRDARRRRRPSRISGTTTSGTTTRTTSDIFGLDSTTMTSPPTSRMTLRAAIDSVDVITVCTIAVSVVMRASTSPVRADSYQAGGNVIRWPNTARLTSARTLSPIWFTSVVRR